MKYGIIGAAVSFLFAVSVLGVMIWDSQQNSHSMIMEADTLGSFIDYERNAARSTYYGPETGN
jgi:hypothetical protein